VGEVHHFTYGWVTPALAYALSVVGCLLGLVCAARARDATSELRRAWMLMLASVSIGGVGIWVLHFIAIIGLSVPGTAIQLDVSITVASFLISVVMTGFGIFAVNMGRRSLLKILVSGPIMGVSVALMHFTGVAALHIHGEFSYDGRLVSVAYAISVVAATLTLWITTLVRSATVTTIAALLIAAAAGGMHHAGAAAMRVRLDQTYDELSGVSVNWFLAPIVLLVILLAFALANAVVALPSAEELHQADVLQVVMGGPAGAGRFPAPGPPSIPPR
jgi:NO-binding membrane sensor protein with MHYT domain